MLVLQEVSFDVDIDTRDTAFFIHDSGDHDGTIEISLDVSFKNNAFMGENVSPSVCINPIKTQAKRLDELIGSSFEVTSINEANEREDTLYIFEHEPFENYKLTILELTPDKVHIQCTGTAITDGYANPYKTSSFQLDCWLPIITGPNDWEKYNL